MQNGAKSCNFERLWKLFRLFTLRRIYMLYIYVFYNIMSVSRGGGVQVPLISYGAKPISFPDKSTSNNELPPEPKPFICEQAFCTTAYRITQTAIFCSTVKSFFFKLQLLPAVQPESDSKVRS